MRAAKLFHVPPAVIAGLLADGKNDRVIGRLYGVTCASVCCYRKKHGLAATKTPRLARVRRDVIEWLVQRGLSDGEIGRVFNVTAAAVCTYRFKHAIATQRPTGRGWAA